MSDVHDKGGGNVDWETHSLRYVVNAIDSAQKHQLKLWKQVVATRARDGTIPVDWPLIGQFVEAVRRTHSMMIDLETVGAEYEAKFSPRKRRSPTAKAGAGKARRKK